MSVWGEVFLGVIAVATLATAIGQVSLLVTAVRLAKRVDRLVGQAERELTPIYGHLNTVGQEAARAAALATGQVERVDRLVAEAVVRLDHSLDAVQHALAIPARESAALVAGLRAALHALRVERRGRPRHSDDEDALFI